MASKPTPSHIRLEIAMRSINTAVDHSDRHLGVIRPAVPQLLGIHLR